MTETWPEYLRRIAAGQTQSQIAERTGIGRLSVCHWLHGKTRPKPETAIAVARVYDRSPIEALLAAGYLHHAEVRLPIENRCSPRDLPAEEIAAEVRRRLVELERTGTPETPGAMSEHAGKPEHDGEVVRTPLSGSRSG